MSWPVKGGRAKENLHMLGEGASCEAGEGRSGQLVSIVLCSRYPFTAWQERVKRSAQRSPATDNGQVPTSCSSTPVEYEQDGGIERRTSLLRMRISRAIEEEAADELARDSGDTQADVEREAAPARCCSRLRARRRVATHSLKRGDCQAGQQMDWRNVEAGRQCRCRCRCRWCLVQ